MNNELFSDLDGIARSLKIEYQRLWDQSNLASGGTRDRMRKQAEDFDRAAAIVLTKRHAVCGIPEYKKAGVYCTFHSTEPKPKIKAEGLLDESYG